MCRLSNPQGLHPRIVAEGFDIAKEKSLQVTNRIKLLLLLLLLLNIQVLEEVKIVKEMDRDILISVASTSLRTKLSSDVADILTEVIRVYP